MLTKANDTLSETIQVRVSDFCSCGNSYIGETRRRLETRLREHQEACRKGTLETSVVALHAWKDQHTIKMQEAAVIDQPDRSGTY